MLLRALMNRNVKTVREFMQNFPLLELEDQEVLGVDDSDDTLWEEGFVWVDVELGNHRLTKAQREFVSARAEEYHMTSKY